MKNRLLLSVILAFVIVSGWGLVSEGTVSDISDGIIRLHIIANSDSASDQLLKLKVRDRILSSDVDYKDLEKIESICRDEIRINGFRYDAVAEWGKFYFPSKQYANISLPAGNYRAVRVVIGNGEGKNWWCVMYPPLCFSDGMNGTMPKEEMNLLKNSIKTDNLELIKKEGVKIKPAFKLVEMWNELFYGKK